MSATATTAIQLFASSTTALVRKPAEEITVAVDASRTTAQWGAAEFHNLENGARASGMVRSAHSLLAGADLDWDPVFRTLQIGGVDVPAEVGRAVVRSDNGQPVGIVGGRYTLIPHRRLAD